MPCAKPLSVAGPVPVPDQMHLGPAGRHHRYPGGAQPGSHLSYSPWCIPTVIGGVKCVIVHRALREHEPMAWDFVMNFAKDNELQVSDQRPE